MPSIVNGPLTTGSELVVNAACAATFQQTIDTIVSHHFDGGGLAGVGVPNKYRFRSCNTSFNPAHASLHVPFSIGSSIRFLAFVANRTTSITKPKLPDTCVALRQPRRPFQASVSGMPNLRRFRSNQRVSIPITCFHVISVHIERGIRVPNPSRAKSSTTGFRPTVADVTCCSYSDHCIPGGC